MQRAAPNRRWLKRAGRVLLVLAVALPLLFLGATNAFLSFGGVSKLFAGTNTINAKYRRAWMLWPGTLHARGVRVVFQDANVEWSLEFERATVDVSLLAFARRTFHAYRLRAEGGSFRMRHRIDPAAKNEPWVRTIAPIPEFLTPAVFEPHVPEAPIRDADYNLWRIHMEDVDAQVNEIWVQFVRYQGAGRARGAFELLPARHLWVGPASLDLAPGRMTIGDAELASSLRGHIGCVVERFDVRVPVGREVLRFINSDLKLHADGFQPTLLTQFFDAAAGGRYELQPGPLDIDVVVRKGIAQSGSSFGFASERAAVSVERVSAEANGLRLGAHLGSEEAGTTTLELGSVKLTLEPKLPAIELATSKAELFTHGADLVGEWQLRGGAVDISQFRVPDARALNTVLASSPVRVLHGELEGALQGKAQGQQRSGALTLRATGLALRAAGLTFSGSTKLDAHVTSGSERPLRAELDVNGSWPKLTIGTAGEDASSSARAELHGVELRASGTSRGRPGLSGKAELAVERAEITAPSRWVRFRPRFDVTIENFDSQRLSGNVDATVALKDAFASHADETGQCSQIKLASAKLSLRSSLTDGKAQGELSGSVNRAAFDWGDFRANADAKLRAKLRDISLTGGGAGTVALGIDVVNATARSGKNGSEGWEMHLPKLATDVAAWLGPGVVGSARVKATELEGRIGGTRFSSELQARVPLFSADLARRSAHFSARVALRRTALQAEDRNVRNWWADLDVRSAMLRARENLDLSAIFEAKLRDATPGVQILDAGGALPGWLAGLIPEQSVKAEGMVQRRCRLTEIRLTSAKDGPIAMHGRLQSESEATRGAFLVRLSSFDVLSAGVAFDAGSTDVAPFAGDGWFREHDATLDGSARDVLQQPCSEPAKSCGAD